MSARVSTSGLHACTAGTSQAEPSAQSLLVVFMVFYLTSLLVPTKRHNGISRQEG